MPLYFNADTQARSFTGLVSADDGSGVTLDAGEVVDIDRPVADRFLTLAENQTTTDARKVVALDTVPVPETEAEPETAPPAPTKPVTPPKAAETLAEAEARAQAADAELAAAQAQTATPDPSTATPTPGA